jgi:putative membrane protein
MSPIHHAATGMSSPSSAIIPVALVFVSFMYALGWRRIPKVPARAIRGWRAASFLFGIFLVWGALGSPLVVYDHDLLTVHMIQHLLLMTFAPALILLGEPLLALSYGLPRFTQILLVQLSRRLLAQTFTRTLFQPAFCWSVSALTLLIWHMPAVFTFGMHSEAWHSFEQASFLGAGFLFWWPVVHPWPCTSTGPQWSTLLYLFLATLPCDILSGFLVFSDRVAYPLYFSTPRHFGFSVLQDQQCAAALMWTCVTIVYLVPTAILSTRLLSPRNFHRGDLVQSELRGSASAAPDPQTVEVA